jgi:hypothetical protein
LCFGEKGIEIDLMATNFKAFSGSWLKTKCFAKK